VELDSRTLRLDRRTVPMIALIASRRSVAVVRQVGMELEYHSVNSSRTVNIGSLPRSGTVFAMAARNPPFRRPWLVVEYSDGAVFAAQLGKKVKLGEWIEAYQPHEPQH
jgi:hypothetical protein